MKILLIYPVPPKSHWPKGQMLARWVPTGLAYIGAVLQRAGHTVKALVRAEQLIKNGFDWVAADAQLHRLLEEFQPEMIGFSVLTPMVPEAGSIARLAKQICGDQVLVAAGGPHPSAIPERMLQECPAIDVIVVGEGEDTMVELAEKGPAKAVAGLVFRDGESFVRTAPRSPEANLDRLGPPAYNLFDMTFYTEPNPWMIHWLRLSATNIRTTRGCPNRCAFCAGTIVSGPGVRYHSINYVMDLVQDVVERFGVKAVHFEDETFAADRSRVLALCEEMRRRGLHKRIQWDCLFRVEQAESELLARMKSAGCIQVEYGFESGSDAALRRVGKNASVEQNRRAVRLTREAGLRIYADIMLGLPGETEEDIRATRRFLRWARPEAICASRMTPLPGTPVYDELPPAVRDSLNWADYTYMDHRADKVNFAAMPAQRFEALYQDFRKHFWRPVTEWGLLRDAPPEDREERRRLRKKLLRFILRHPLRAARLPIFR